MYPIHTFAFGQYTACTSSMLMPISESFNGMFGYIQDAKTLGTIFINGIAYTLCTAVTSFLAQVELNGEILKPRFKFVEKDSVLTYPGLRYGQSCDILFNLCSPIATLALS